MGNASAVGIQAKGTGLRFPCIIAGGGAVNWTDSFRGGDGVLGASLVSSSYLSQSGFDCKTLPQKEQGGKDDQGRSMTLIWGPYMHMKT